MRFIQQTPACADFDVWLDTDGPVFRMLIPELITAEQPLTESPLLHQIAGVWQVGEGRADGAFTTPHPLSLQVSVREDDNAVRIAITVRNDLPYVLTGVRANICVALNHLPGTPDWMNPRFLPALPLDRAAQGRCWYETVSPRRLHALTPAGWIPLHAHPAQPDADAVPLYNFTPTERDDLLACAVASQEDDALLFQAWSTPSRGIPPFPGNACMHLLPEVAERLAPGSAATLRGLIGLHIGDRTSLANRLTQFRQDNIDG